MCETIVHQCIVQRTVILQLPACNQWPWCSFVCKLLIWIGLKCLCKESKEETSCDSRAGKISYWNLGNAEMFFFGCGSINRLCGHNDALEEKHYSCSSQILILGSNAMHTFDKAQWKRCSTKCIDGTALLLPNGHLYINNRMILLISKLTAVNI